MSELKSLATLHRYWIWCNYMREHMDAVLTKSTPTGAFYKEPDFQMFMYMSYWYAGLYVVIEGWRRLNLRDPSIDALLVSPNVHLLKRYRHAVYHFQKDYLDDRFVGFWSERETVRWVRSVNRAFGAFFLRELGAHRSATKR